MAGEEKRLQLGFLQRLELRNVMQLVFVFSVGRFWASLLRSQSDVASFKTTSWAGMPHSVFK